MSSLKANMAEIVDVQNTIIRMQSDIINQIFLVLGQYVSVEELDNMEVLEKINEAARLRASLDVKL